MARAAKLYAIYRQAKLQVRAADEAKALAASNSSGGRSYWIRYIDAGLSITTK